MLLALRAYLTVLYLTPLMVSRVYQKIRAKKFKVAEQMGWKPNMAAKALSDASTRTVGLVIEVDSEVLSVESYFMELIAGLGDALEDYDYSLLVRIVSDSQNAMRIHRNWIATGSVDAMLVMNVEVGDRVLTSYKTPAMPVLVIADPSVTHGLPSMTSDDAEGASA